MRSSPFLSFAMMVAVIAAKSAVASDGERKCVTSKFGLNNSDEVCAELTFGKKNVLLRMETDVATYDPVSPAASKITVAKSICKLFGFGDNVPFSMTFRKSENAGFIGGGAILGGGTKKISTIDTLRCRNTK